MTLPIPLTVQLSTARTTKHIEAGLRSLRFRSVAPGGFASATFSLDRPLSQSPDELAYYADVDIYDARNGNCVWCGRLEDPGRGVGSDGQVWDLAAVGPSAHARDWQRSLIYIDRSLERWEVSSALSNKSARVGVDDVGEDDPSLLMQAPEGITVASGWIGDMIYRAIWASDQLLAKVNVGSVRNGLSTGNWKNEIITRVGAGAPTAAHQVDWSTTAQAMEAARGGVNAIPSGHNVANLRINRTGVGVTGTDLTWGEFWNISVRAILKDRFGTDIVSGYTNATILASQIVEDLLGRMLTKYDSTTATVETTTFQIFQAAWPDGITPAEVFDELMMLEPDFYWAAWETLANGLHRFEWRTWPTHVRYEADATDGFDSPGSAEELYNRVIVRRRNARGRILTTTRTQDVPELTSAGLTRSRLVDLGDEIGIMLAQAQRVGDAFLSQHATPPNAGTLTVARPIYDHDRGCSVMPWEIRPGHLIRVRGVQPNTDRLNATGRDGVTVFRIVGHTYDTASASASLDLDLSPNTLAHLLARGGAHPPHKRRR